MLQNTTLFIKSYASFLGISIMSLATIVGMMRMPNHSVNRYVLPGQVIRVETNNTDDINNPVSREKDDVVPAYVSYSETQRTPSRSGKY